MFRVTVVSAVFTLAAAAQTFSPLNCTATAVPALIRLEGITEQVGDIVLNCAGGTPNGTVRGDIRVISFGGNITNKLNPSTNTLDAVLTVNTGAGEVSAGAAAALRGANQFDFAGLNVTLGASGTAVFRISNVRVVPPSTPRQPLQIALATNGPSAIRIDNSPLTAGIATQGLLSTFSSSFFCTVSPAGAENHIDSFLRAGTRFASIRFTEGFSESFRRREPLNDHGTRFAIRYSGFPAGARLFVPDAIVGSSGAIPTAAGDLGLAPNGGRYLANLGNALLLARVRNVEPNGAGGRPAVPIPAVTTNYGALSEVPLSGGSGVAVFEVMDADRTARETFQVPTFLVLDQRPAGGSVTAQVAAHFAPFSTDGAASAGPVPRFQALNPPPDCEALGDCNAGFFPKLLVESETLTYNILGGAAAQTRFIRIRNEGGGFLNWATSVQYRSGANWLTVDPPAGIGNATVRVDASSAGLQPGTYEAVLTIDAGPVAGRVSGPVTLTVRQLTLPVPEITSIVHGATFERTALAPGTIATAFGTQLRDARVSVNGTEARVFFSNNTQINFEVPAPLPTAGTVNVIASLDGRPGAPRALSLTAASPGIFEGAVLNQDFSPNTAANPAQSGSVVQIFLTGLPTNRPVTVKIHDYTVTPVYAGAAPGFVGLQQVNAGVPAELQSITSDIQVCSGDVCSPRRPVTVRQP